MQTENEFEVHTMGDALSGSSGGGGLSGQNANKSNSYQSSSPLPKAAEQPNSQVGNHGIGASQPQSSTRLQSMTGGGSLPAPIKPASSMESGIGSVNVGVHSRSQEILNGNVGSGGSNSSKLFKIIIGVFVGIVLVGGGVFAFFIIQGDSSSTINVEPNEFNTDIEDDIDDKSILPNDVMVPVSTPSKAISNKEYSDELLNYLIIDPQSDTILLDIKEELDVIRANLPAQNISIPITFSIADENNRPISFSDFTVHANMNMPSDILLALEDEFGLYAYNDSTGVRFGFEVSAKNETNLVTALAANADKIPQSMMIFFKNFSIDPAQELKFNDGTYKDHSIKYMNLNDAESKSIDYTIEDGSWIVGTNKNTMRAILDLIDGVDITDDTSTATTTTPNSTIIIDDSAGAIE